MINTDDISLDEILDGFDRQTQSEEVDFEKMNRIFHERYPNELKKYKYVKYQDISSVLGLGTVIKYTKINSDRISCSCFIKKIAYLNMDIKVIDYILVAISTNTIWKIYPTSYHIFVLNRFADSDEKVEKLRSKFINDGNKFRNVTIERSALKKILKNNEPQFVEKTDVDYKVDSLLNNFEKGKTNSSKKNYLKMSGHHIGLDQVDIVANDIFKYHISVRNRSKSKK